MIGERAYNEAAWQPIGPLAAERLVARRAFGLPPLGRNADRTFDLAHLYEEQQAGVLAASFGFVNDSPPRRAVWR